MRSLLFAILSLLFASRLSAQQVAHWDFEAPLEKAFTTAGKVNFDAAGPRSPEYPGFSNTNSAVQLGGAGSRLMLADPGEDSVYDFTNGDQITLEAWVQLDKASGSGTPTIVSKGRTHQPGFPTDNQNWALRITTADGMGKLNFLFASDPKASSQHWHRWTSDSGFSLDSGWHHVAVAYQFGEPDSLRGWIDGLPMAGTWDLGGKTTAPPVTDNDAVWIGSTMNGGASGTLLGFVDEIRIHRTLLDHQTIAARFDRVGGPRVLIPLPASMPHLGTLPAGEVAVILSEGMQSDRRWIHLGESEPVERQRFASDSMMLGRIPVRYNEHGLRTSWNAPLLVTMATDAELPAGDLELLLRVRALSRLWIDGQLITETEAILKQPPNGEEEVTPVSQPLVPGQRVPGYHQQQQIISVNLPELPVGTTTRRVVLEMLVGGPQLRVETGEITVGYRTQPDTIFHVLPPAGAPSFPLTDNEVLPRLHLLHDQITRLERSTRQRAAASRQEYWNQRHQLASELAAQQRPPVPADHAALHPVDAFLKQANQQALQESAATDPDQSAHFQSQVLPLLRSRCFRCHGDQDKGGLRLNSHAGLLTAGDSGDPAVVPGDPDASLLIARISGDTAGDQMPPGPDRMTADQIALLADWIRDGAEWPALPVTADDLQQPVATDDEAFLRRVFLDLAGVPPTLPEYRHFLAQPIAERRSQLIDQLLEDDRFADNMMGEWQDLLAENPTLLNQSQGSTGPFRFFLHESFLDRKPLDRMITELLMMEGGAHEGGPAGFAMAAENDAPMAAKAHIAAAAFLGIDMQCARCHDAPYHSTTQKDLFSLAAMLQRKTITVPVSSRVPAEFFAAHKLRTPLIEVTLRPDEPVPATWPFGDLLGLPDDEQIVRLMRNPEDSRERLAVLITAPQNRRFARVITNRVWARLMGRGLVEPLHDWEGRQCVNPQLLDWLAAEFVASGYDLRHLFRTIMNSETWQRTAFQGDPEIAARFFPGPLKRRLSAEQIVDSLYTAVGANMNIEPMTFVHDGRRALSNRQTLGQPERAWMLASLNNERDRPSLSLPAARTVADVLQAFGWNGSRQMPISRRDMDANLLQPGILANGILTTTLTRASWNSELAELAVHASSAADLLDELFIRILCRTPTASERDHFLPALQHGFENRVLPADQQLQISPLPPLPLITWFNHQRHAANATQQLLEARVEQGPPADPRLHGVWREVYEDLVWSLINHSEFVWVP